MALKKKYSWESLIKKSQLNNGNDSLSVYDEVVKLFSESSAEDRKKILEVFKGLVGEEYAKKMISSSDIETFKNITSSFEESALYDIKHIMQTARNRNDEYDYHSVLDEDDEDYDDVYTDDETISKQEQSEDKKKKKEKDEDRMKKRIQKHKKSSLLYKLISQAADNKMNLQTALAAWEKKDQKALFDEFVGLFGSGYTKDMVRDHKPRGTARDVSKPQSSGQLDDSKGMNSIDGSVSEQKDSSTTDASFRRNVKTASKADRNTVQNLFKGLLGSDFSSKLVEEYTVKGKTSDKKTSGQTKTSSFDPWSLNKTSNDFNDKALKERPIDTNTLYNNLSDKEKEKVKNLPRKHTKTNEDSETLRSYHTYPETRVVKEKVDLPRKHTKVSKREYDPNPWAVCTESTGREDKDKYESCVQNVKKKQKDSKPLKKK